MGKPLVNKKKWTRNEFRLLVVLLLTVLYPIVISSFFAIFFFVIMPFYGWPLGPHLYWLVASVIWLILCSAILPCFADTDVKEKPFGMGIQEGPTYSTKAHAVQPFVKVEEVDERNRASVLTNKSKGSSESIEKDICEEKADREVLEKSQDDFQKSVSSLEKEKITESGEFLNEFMGSLGTDKLQEEEAECEVHIEQESRELELNVSAHRNDTEKATESNLSADSDDEPPNKVDKEILTASTLDPKGDKDDAECTSANVRQNESDPLVLQGDIHESETLKDEVSELQDESPVKMRKPLPSIDTSRASGYYECSMPTPKSNDRPESNMVFLFVNPETAATEDDIIVNHQGEVQEHKD